VDNPLSEPIKIAVNGRLRANDSEALRDAALAGLGIALLPTWLVGPDVRERRLIAVLPKWEWLIAPGPERAIWAVYPPKQVVSPKVKAFLAFLSQCLPAHLGDLPNNDQTAACGQQSPQPQ
jgi:DNA-binding transcriptional LysR family regulator